MPEPQLRIVPGAPPPAPLTKSQKKKRRTKVKTGTENSADGNDIDRVDSPVTTIPDAPASALIEKAPSVGDVQKGALAPELVAPPDAETPVVPDESKLSPIVELINKRLKTTTKKITRISTYAATEPEQLNDDQKRILKTLPTLEAIQKELAEVKKAVEAHEASLIHESIAKKIEAEKAEIARRAEAVATAQGASIEKTVDILNLLRLRSLLTSAESNTLSIDQTEASTILSIANTLLSTGDEKRVAIIKGFLQGSGDFDGIPYTRLVEITNAGLVPPRVQTPPPAEKVEQAEQAEVVEESLTSPDVTVAGIPGTASAAKSFSFGEIDEAQPGDDGEWVDAAVHEQSPQEELPNGHTAAVVGQVEETVIPAIEEPTTGASLDWAADETDLPPISSVQESFGTSGIAMSADAHEMGASQMNGPRPRRRPQDEEGYTRGRDGRGRGRMFRGERGSYRGPRGERGAFRGGDRGGFRGRGGEGRGEGRSEGRGGYRGRGEWRGNGEYRGRGRGRGRGGERGGFASAPHAQAPHPAPDV